MRIVIEDDAEPTISGLRPSIGAGEAVDAGPAPTALIRQFAPELLAEQQDEGSQPEKKGRSKKKGETPANPLRAGAAVARQRVGAETADRGSTETSKAGPAPKRRTRKTGK